MAGAWADVIESHYLATKDGLFFAVKGLVHPPERIIACVRYAPDAAGERLAAGQRYRRLYHFAEQEALLRECYPQYLAFDPACQVVLQSVPHAQVDQIYDPRRRLQDLREQSSRDRLAEDSVAFAALLAREAGIPGTVIGVSGSLLIGLHRPESDLDITVYGLAQGRAVQAALQCLLDTGAHPELARLDADGEQALYAERVADSQMAFADFLTVERGKINQGQFRGRPYFLRFVPAPDEIADCYGDYQYTPAGRATVLASVVDASLSIFTPCVYPLAEVTWLEGVAVPDLREIVSYRGRFCEQALAGDRVEACGQVERVEAHNGQAWHRLLLGNTVEDTMVLRGV
jgi:uncharacterized protein